MKLKALALAGVVALGVAAVAGASNDALAAVTCPSGSIHQGQAKPTYAECNLETNGQPDLMKTVQTILNVVVGVLGVVAVAVVIFGGVLYVTSTGETAKLARAKNTILYGIVGLVVAMLAFAIINFVLASVFGGNAGGTGGGTGGNNNSNNNNGGPTLEQIQ